MGGFRESGPPIIMNVLIWNCHGLGPPWVIQSPKKLVAQKKSSIIFLCDTLCKIERVQRVQAALGFEGMIAVDSQGQGVA